MHKGQIEKCSECGKELSQNENYYCSQCRSKIITLFKLNKKNGNDIIGELAQYLKKRRSEIVKKVILGQKLIKEEWLKKNPKSKDEILKFYQESENYIYDLTLAHSIPSFKEETNFAVKTCVKYSCKSVLDFGGGIGEASIALANAGLNVTYADVSKQLIDYVSWRIKKRKLKVKIVDLRKQKIKGKFDAIVCFDVIEHLTNPFEEMKNIIKHLNHNGIIIINERFPENRTGDHKHPMHLKYNWIYKKNFIFRMEEMKLKLSETFQTSRHNRIVYVFINRNKK